MLSNYPPGVSGNEPEIAGFPEGSRFVECDNDEAVGLSREQVEDAVRAYSPAPDGGEPLSRVLRELPEAVVGECQFSGEADGAWTHTRPSSIAIFSWTCPWCGLDQDTEVTDD